LTVGRGTTVSVDENLRGGGHALLKTVDDNTANAIAAATTVAVAVVNRLEKG